MATLRFQVGSTEHEFARIEVVRSNGDGWLPSQITVRVGAFHGEFPSNLDVWAFSRFASELKMLYESLKGTASFSSYDGQLELTLTGDGLGHVMVTGEAMDYAGIGNKLTFRLATLDQTELPALLRDLNAISTTYPPPLNKSMEQTRER
jgi:hypothetical protein